MWQMEKPLERVKPLIDGWQMLIVKCGRWKATERWQMLTAFFGFCLARMAYNLAEMADVVATVADGIDIQDRMF